MPGIAIKPGNPRVRGGHPLARYLSLALVWPDAGPKVGRDVSAQRNHATLTGGVSDSAGPTGRALNFTASSSGRGDCARQAIRSNAYTISALVVPRRDGSSGSAGNGIVYQGAGGGSQGTEFGLGFFGAGQLFFRAFAASSSQTSATGLYALNVPVRVGLTYNTGAWQFWVNGLGKDSGGTVGSVLTLPDAFSTSVGYWFSNADTTRYFDGLMGDVLIFDGIAFNAAQWAQHTRDPYAVLRPRRRWAMLAAAAGAGAAAGGSTRTRRTLHTIAGSRRVA
jgi:hypothetical protein